MSPAVCPNCGADVPHKAKACPECGADEHTGWLDQTHADNLGLPDENFDYDEFVQREFGPKKAVPRGIHWFWWLVAVALILGFFWSWFGR